MPENLQILCQSKIWNPKKPENEKKQISEWVKENVKKIFFENVKKN